MEDVNQTGGLFIHNSHITIQNSEFHNVSLSFLPRAEERPREEILRSAQNDTERGAIWSSQFIIRNDELFLLPND